MRKHKKTKKSNIRKLIEILLMLTSLEIIFLMFASSIINKL